MSESKFKIGDWVAWYDRRLRRPAIVNDVNGDKIEITIWVDADDCNYVPKH